MANINVFIPWIICADGLLILLSLFLYFLFAVKSLAAFFKSGHLLLFAVSIVAFLPLLFPLPLVYGGCVLFLWVRPAIEPVDILTVVCALIPAAYFLGVALYGRMRKDSSLFRGGMFGLCVNLFSFLAGIAAGVFFIVGLLAVGSAIQ